MIEIAGSVVVVTGASRGIGRATAELLTRRGAQVVAVSRHADDLAKVAAASTVAVDLRDPAASDAVVRHALEVHGRLDGIVANAGVGHLGPVHEMAAERVAELVDVNLRAPLLLAGAALPAMLLAGGGSLVFVGSIAGSLGVPNETVYSATKAGLHAFAATLGEELHGTGVTVSTIVPGVVDTEFFARRGAPYDRRFPRPLPPERVAFAVARALETGTPRIVVPRWLTVPQSLSATAPMLYRWLARRFG